MTKRTSLVADSEPDDIVNKRYKTNGTTRATRNRVYSSGDAIVAPGVLDPATEDRVQCSQTSAGAGGSQTPAESVVDEMVNIMVANDNVPEAEDCRERLRSFTSEQFLEEQPVPGSGKCHKPVKWTAEHYRRMARYHFVMGLCESVPEAHLIRLDKLLLELWPDCTVW